MAWINADIMIKRVLIVSLIGIIIPLGISLLYQSKLWGKAWQEQQEILDALPQSVVDLASPSSLILFDIPHGTPPVHTFSSYWDISGAVILRMGSFVKLEEPYAYASVARSSEWLTTWDGKIVRQYWCNNPTNPLWGLEASQLYKWIYPNTEALELVAPFEYGCNN